MYLSELITEFLAQLIERKYNEAEFLKEFLEKYKRLYSNFLQVGTCTVLLNFSKETGKDYNILYNAYASKVRTLLAEEKIFLDNRGFVHIKDEEGIFVSCSFDEFLKIVEKIE